MRPAERCAAGSGGTWQNRGGARRQERHRQEVDGGRVCKRCAHSSNPRCCSWLPPPRAGNPEPRGTLGRAQRLPGVPADPRGDGRSCRGGRWRRTAVSPRDSETGTGDRTFSQGCPWPLARSCRTRWVTGPGAGTAGSLRRGRSALRDCSRGTVLFSSWKGCWRGNPPRPHPGLPAPIPRPCPPHTPFHPTQTPPDLGPGPGPTPGIPRPHPTQTPPNPQALPHPRAHLTPDPIQASPQASGSPPQTPPHPAPAPPHPDPAPPRPHPGPRGWAPISTPPHPRLHPSLRPRPTRGTLA